MGGDAKGKGAVAKAAGLLFCILIKNFPSCHLPAQRVGQNGPPSSSQRRCIYTPRTWWPPQQRRMASSNGGWTYITGRWEEGEKKIKIGKNKGWGWGLIGPRAFALQAKPAEFLCNPVVLVKIHPGQGRPALPAFPSLHSSAAKKKARLVRRRPRKMMGKKDRCLAMTVWGGRGIVEGGRG